MSILLTGATGFIGGALIECLHQQQLPIIAAVRASDNRLPSNVKQVSIGDLASSTDWDQALLGVDTVIHLAARVHIMRDASVNPLAAFREVNTNATLNLARQAADAGARRFIYLSSIKVNGENTIDKPFTADQYSDASDPYGISKDEAEKGLLDIARQTAMEIVIIRPPLVYGPGVRGNFLSMLNWLQRGIPLPLGAVNNQRSLVFIDNLVDLIITCIEHPAAANQTFLVSDGDDLSTTELLRGMGKALDKPVYLIPVPPLLLNLGATVIGKKDVAQRLLGNLQVDISKAQEGLNWTPPVTIEDGLYKTAQWYLGKESR